MYLCESIKSSFSKESFEAMVSLRLCVNCCACFVCVCFLEFEGKKDVTQRKKKGKEVEKGEIEGKFLFPIFFF